MASRHPLLLPWLLLAAGVALFATPAAADPSPQQKELARDLMQRGYAARGAHDPKVALESFKGADDIMHVPTTGFEVARSQADLGLLVEAHETLLQVMRMKERPGEPQAFRDARGYAKVLDQQLGPRIPQLRISVSGAPSATVNVDGTELPEGALLVPYKVDPGHHVVAATAGAVTGRTETDVGEGEVKDVQVSLQATPTPAPAPPPAAPIVPESAEPEATPAHRGFGPLAWAGFGIAVVGVGVGAVTGVMTLNGKSSVASECNGKLCPPSTYDKIDSANTLATVSTIAFAVGGAGAALGLAAWFLGWGAESPSSAPSSGQAVHIEPRIGLGTAGVGGSF
ncbi:MAG TPA: hypothetical protein VF765_22485 [Polyangiaceae bacterium]